MTIVNCLFGSSTDIIEWIDACDIEYSEATTWEPCTGVSVMVAGGRSSVSRSGRTIVIGHVADMRSAYGAEIPSSEPAIVEQVEKRVSERGVSGLKGLCGNFLILAIPERGAEIYLAADMPGSVPAYFTRNGTGWAISSRLRAIAGLPGFKRRPNRNTVQSFQYSGWAPRGSTFLADVRAVEPASIHILTIGGHRRVTTLDLQASAQDYGETVKAAADVVDDFLGKAIERHITHFDQVGVALSGGVDSIYLLAKLRQVSSSRRLQSFTFGYGENDPQMKRAAEVADLYGSDHHETVVRADELEDLLKISVRYLEEPVGRDHFPSLIKMAIEAAGKVNVLLFGNGVEQSFTGEEVHRRIQLAERHPWALPLLEDFASLDYSGAAPCTALGKCMVSVRERFLGKATPPAARVLYSVGVADRVNYHYPVPALANFMRLDLARAKGHFRVKAAALGDLANIEMRTPFYDTSVIDLGLRMRESLKLRRGIGKYVFRHAAQNVLPRHLAWLPKGVSRLRHDDRFWEVLLDMASRYASEAIVRSRGIFDASSVRILREDVTRRRRTTRWLYRLWYIVALEMWMQAFIDCPTMDDDL